MEELVDPHSSEGRPSLAPMCACEICGLQPRYVPSIRYPSTQSALFFHTLRTVHVLFILCSTGCVSEFQPCWHPSAASPSSTGRQSNLARMRQVERRCVVCRTFAAYSPADALTAKPPDTVVQHFTSLPPLLVPFSDTVCPGPSSNLLQSSFHGLRSTQRQPSPLQN